MWIVFLIGWLGALTAAFVIFDLVVRELYSRHRNAWESEGNPHGFFFVPKEAMSPQGFVTLKDRRARNRQYYVLLFRTPVWAANDPKVRQMGYLFRILHLVSVPLFAAFIYFLYS